MFITNGKVITTNDQNDLETLQKFVENLFNVFSTGKEVPLEPKDYYTETPLYAAYNVPDGMNVNFMTEQGISLVGIEVDDIIERAGINLITHRYNFTQEEAAQNAMQLADAMKAKDAIELEKTERMSAFKNQIDLKNTEIRKYRDMVSDGYEMRDTKCKTQVDYGEGQRNYIDLNSGKVIKSEPLTLEDKQQMVLFGPNGNSNAPTPPSATTPLYNDPNVLDEEEDDYKPF